MAVSAGTLPVRGVGERLTNTLGRRRRQAWGGWFSDYVAAVGMLEGPPRSA
jgi:hypothetical protein